MAGNNSPKILVFNTGSNSLKFQVVAPQSPSPQLVRGRKLLSGVVERYYAIPWDITRRHGIQRFGFHGISHHYVVLRYAELTQTPLERTNVITLHLEGGSSATAVLGGKSIDTSMGFTPLEGLMMGTRSGDLDPALVEFLARKEHATVEEVESLLNKKSGLRGVSGTSADTRELVQNPGARADLALEMFAYRVRKYIGAYLAAMNGASAVVFGGGIGENTPEARRRICRTSNTWGWSLTRIGT
jgi:acetate kinase